MSKLSKEPWEAREDGEYIRIYAGTAYIATVYRSPALPEYDTEAWAIAHLIEAAPAMLEALKRLLPVAENWACNCEINGEGPDNPAAVIVRKARAVIAQAEGKERHGLRMQD